MSNDLPNKRYNIIYADPPWDIGGYVHSGNHVDLPYQTMPDIEIIDLPVKNIADDNSILFLWCVDSKIPIMHTLMLAWGFEYKCLGFIWNKKAKTTKGTCAPFPNFTRRSCEYCFIGVRGKYKIFSKTVEQLISTYMNGHSTKPHIFRTLIVELCGDLPRIELFSRENIEGWDAWGNQVPTHCQRSLCWRGGEW